MGASECPCTHLAVIAEPLRRHRLGLEGELPVAQLPDVEVPDDPVRSWIEPQPAKEDVARRLHQPLALDHSLALVLEPAGASELAQHRRTSLLDLQEQRV